MKSATLFASVLWVLSCGPVSAEPSSTLAWTPETLAALKTGAAARGEGLAESCASCHANGGQFPYLDGQLAPYLYKQLHDYKDGSRANPIMTGLVAGLSPQDMADVSVYYSQQDIPPPPRQKETASEAAELLVKQGDSRRILPPCAACHEASGKGQKIDVPAIAGQNAAYLEQTLLDYKNGARRNDLYARMRDITRQLSEEEISQLARYYASLGR